MTIEEIFRKIVTHMNKGVQMHKDLIHIWDFLGLKGFKKCHYYHYLEESMNEQDCLSYYMKHYHKILHRDVFEEIQLVPSTWQKYTQFEVDINTKRNTIRELFKTWIEWEKSTKVLLQDSYNELWELKEFAAASKINTYLADVSQELAYAEEYFLTLENTGYDLAYILDQQPQIHKKYSQKIKRQLSR